MAHETYPINPTDGPILAVRASPAGLTTPPPMQVSAVVDTGSNVTGISERVIHHLSLPVANWARTSTAGGIVTVAMYKIDLSLMNLFGGVLKGFNDLSAMGIAHPIDAVEAILGRDVLEVMRMHYDGPAACFTLSD